MHRRAGTMSLGVGVCGIAVAAGLAFAAEGDTPSIGSAAPTEIRMTIKPRGRTDRRLLWLHGLERRFGVFRVTVHLPRVPCSGWYRFNGTAYERGGSGRGGYKSRIRLRARSRSARRGNCGRPIGTIGRRGAALSVRTRPRGGAVAFSITGHRIRGTVFTGTLKIRQLMCNRRPYYLNSWFRIGKKVRRYRYRVSVRGATFRGRPVNCR